jgi:serine/threonine protein kinase
MQAIVDGDPPDLPTDKYSEEAIEFVRGCLNKIPKLRPTYAMLIRHPWLAALMKPPTISEDEEAEAAAEAGDSMGNSGTVLEDQPTTADKEVAEWVKTQLEKKREGKMSFAKKPALHEAPLDAVPGSPLLSHDDAPAKVDGEEAHEEVIKPNPGVRVNSPELISAQIEPVDFAANIDSSPDEQSQ